MSLGTESHASQQEGPLCEVASTDSARYRCRSSESWPMDVSHCFYKAHSMEHSLDFRETSVWGRLSNPPNRIRLEQGSIIVPQPLSGMQAHVNC